jgi:hypothetical protein
MNKNNLLFSIMAAIIILMIGVVIGIKVADRSGQTGGLVHHVQEIFSAGLIAEGNIEGTSATLSSTLAVTGETNLDTLVQGGDVWSTSTDVAATLTAAHVCDNSVIRVDPLVSAVNLTLPATSTLYADCLTTAGDTKEFLLENATSGAAAITIVAGTGVTLLEPSGGDVVINQNEWALFRMTYVDGMEVAVTVTSIQDAD